MDIVRKINNYLHIIVAGGKFITYETPYSGDPSLTAYPIPLPDDGPTSAKGI
jgi:hypothetical protein